MAGSLGRIIFIGQVGAVLQDKYVREVAQIVFYKKLYYTSHDICILQINISYKQNNIYCTKM